MTDRLAAWCADFAVRRRWPVLIVTALLVAACAYPAVFIPMDAAYEIWFLESDPALQAYHEFQELFGNDEFLLVILDTGTGTIFENRTLESLARMTGILAEAPNVQSTVSLSRYETIHGENDELSLRPALDELPLTDQQLAETRERVLADPLATASVVSPDGSLATIVVEMEHRPGEFTHRTGLVDRVREEMDREFARSGIRYQVAGGAVLDQDIMGKTTRDFVRNIPMVAGFIFFFLIFTIRNFWGTLLPLITVIGAIFIARVFIPVMGWKDNNMLMIVPLVVLAIGVADSVHIVVHFLRQRGNGFSGPDAARDAVRKLFKPCLLTSFTTAAGFLALQTASLMPLRQLGLITAIGVTAAFVFSVLPLPAALSLLPGNPQSRHARLESGLFSRLVARLPDFTERRRRSILVMALAVTVLGVGGLFQIQVESNAIEMFHKDDPMRVLAEELERKAGGIGSLEMVITGGNELGLKDPEILRAMDDFSRWLEQRDLISSSHSVVDYLKTINQAMHDDDPAYFKVPDDPALVSQYLLLYDAASTSESGVERLLDLTQTKGRLYARSMFGTLNQYRELQKDVEAYVHANFPPQAQVEYTGIITLYRNMGEYIIWSQIRSFLVALTIITVTMIVTFRSFTVGLLSLIPNVWPILLTMGFMGWRDIWLEPSTAMVAAVSIGIAVDDSVHFLHKYLEKRKLGGTTRESVRHAFNISGRAIVFTTVILLAGFLAVTFSEFKPYVNFGFLCAMAIFLALVGDLLILPAVFYTLELFRERKVQVRARAAVIPLVGLALLLPPSPARGEDDDRGRAVLEAVAEATEVPDSESSTMRMTLRDRRGRTVERRAELAVLGAEGGSRSLIRFTDPADLRGTAFLTHEKDGENDQWLYLPALGRAKRIAASGKSASFVGTEFSYEDLSGRDLDAYTHRWLRAEELDGEQADVVESVSADETSAYSRLVTWVSSERPVALQVEYYDRKDRLFKRSRASGFAEVSPGRWRADTLVMENLLSGKATLIDIEDRELNPDLDESQFTVESLKAGW